MAKALRELEVRCVERDTKLSQMRQLETLHGTQSLTRREAISWFHQAFRHCPFPAWVKDSEHVVLGVNPAYSELYEVAGNQGLSFVGSDDEAWPAPIADDFHKYDKKALIDGYTITHEHVYNPVTGIREAIMGAKWLVKLVDGDQLVMGIASGITPKPKSALRDGR